MIVRIGFTLVLLIAALTHAQTSANEEGSVWDGVYSVSQAKKGAKLFVTHCIACHATQAGEVSGHAPAPSVIGEDFEFRWLDSSLADLFDVVRQTMPEGAPNSLSPGEYAALTAYLLQLNGYPAGVSDLDVSGYDSMTRIWIEKKPQRR